MKNLVLIISVFVFTNTLFCGSIFSKPLADKIEINDSEKRMLVYKDNGIMVYFKEVVYKKDSPVYLEVVIENTNAQDIEISWEVKDKERSVLISETSPVKANSVYKNFTSNRIIQIKSGTLMSDFTFVIN